MNRGERLSIAFLSHHASPNAPTGAERSLALLAGGLVERGHRVAVVAPDAWALADDLRTANVAVARIPSRACWMTYYEPRPWPVALVKWIRGVWPQAARSQIRDFLRDWNPDVVHVNCLPHLVGAAAAFDAGFPVVWHLREILPAGRRRRWLAGRLEKHATRIVAVSEAVARWVREEGLGSRLSVVHNGVTPPAPVGDSAAARRKLGIPEEGVLVGLYGQLVVHKGPLEFIEAARIALQRAPELRFAIAGAGPESFRARVRSTLQASGVAERIHLLPPQPSGEPLIAATDVVCLATTTPDPFPRAVLEAMAAGKPVAAFDSGGTGEMVVDGTTGLIVPTGETAALAEAFVRLSADPGLRESMGRAGEQRAREEFTLSRHVDRMEELFRGMAG